MLRVVKIKDVRAPENQVRVREVQGILRAQFPGMPEAEVGKLPEQLESPIEFDFISELIVIEDGRGTIKAFAVLLFFSDLRVAYLETISTAPGRTGGGLGTALYEAVREEANGLGAKGLYFECLPDDPALSPDAVIRRQNASRLRFYERYGARPIMGTDYETPVTAGTTDSPYLVFDGLDRRTLPRAAELRKIYEAILVRKYGDVCPPEYVARVVGSVKDGKFRLREARNEDKANARSSAATAAPKSLGRMPIVVNDAHTIHHVRERGYVEAPVRVSAILKELDKTELFERVPIKPFADRWIREVHDGGLVEYIEQACKEAPTNKSVYPYVFPIRNAARKPTERSVLAGYWCIDTFTPINRNAWPAARQAVDCALTAADAVLAGKPMAYALVRPPGHHAEHRAFGGFCYFCNAAVAANYLARHGKVAILDIDYHHGNGQQDIFYERSDVLTVSIHGNPSFAYPYFTGFSDEKGRSAGAGFNLNLPLPETITPQEHRDAIAQGMKRIARHEPAYLVVALGLDTGKGDPTGTWANTAADFAKIGRLVGAAGYPTIVIQEGGYRVRTLGVNARNFFSGLSEGLAQAHAEGRFGKPGAQRRTRSGRPVRPSFEARTLTWSETVTEADVEPVRRLVEGTGMFSAAEVGVAAELVSERIAKGRVSGYEFVLAREGEELLGYACWGRTPATEATFDLYWIVVSADLQRAGLGRQLLAQVEAAVKREGGGHIYADTSGTDHYRPTRGFYRKTGFRKVAELPDFYRPGDAKVIFAKEI